MIDPDQHYLVGGVDPARFPTRLRAHAAGAVTTDPDGPLYDAAAQALALGAVTAVESSLPWNSLVVPGISAYEVRVDLSRNGVDSASDWVEHIGRALAPDAFGDLETILSFRAELMRRDGRAVSADLWRSRMHDWLSATGQDDDAHGSIDAIGPVVDEVDERIADSGLLPDGTLVRSVGGFQAARTVDAIRWGAQSGYADRDAIMQSLFAARDIAGTQLVDWSEFAASMLAGVTASVAPDDRDDVWSETFGAVATLLTAPDSPWVNIEFPLITTFTDLPSPGADTW